MRDVVVAERAHFEIFSRVDSRVELKTAAACWVWADKRLVLYDTIPIFFN